jgi:hypothetical protein
LYGALISRSDGLIPRLQSPRYDSNPGNLRRPPSLDTFKASTQPRQPSS